MSSESPVPLLQPSPKGFYSEPTTIEEASRAISRDTNDFDPGAVTADDYSPVPHTRSEKGTYSHLPSTAGSIMEGDNTVDGADIIGQKQKQKETNGMNGSNKRRKTKTRMEDIDAEEQDAEESPRHSNAANAASPTSPSARSSPASPVKCINPAGKTAEAGIIKSVYVENFMCHRKLTVDLCRNVNFIHGQNGSGKSAVLAAVQICLGAGARRTHRARNLKDLIRKGGGGTSNPSNAKVRVTLLNQGNDAYEPSKYGNQIIVERCIAGPGSSGYNGYKLLSSSGKEISRLKKDLDNMLDQLNIQVDNPVAVLDQEEAKKFLTGRAEDKYSFFMRATELDRMDRSYASVHDNILDLDDTATRVRKSLQPSYETVKKLKREWEEYQELEKLEEKMLDFRVMYAWSVVNNIGNDIVGEQQVLQRAHDKHRQRQEELERAIEAASAERTDETALQNRLALLTAEAREAANNKSQLENNLKMAAAPLRQSEHELSACKREKAAAAKALTHATRHLREVREQMLQLAGNLQSDEARRTSRMNDLEKELEAIQSGINDKKLAVSNYLKEYDELDPHVDQSKSDVDFANAQLGAVSKRVQDLMASANNSIAIFGQKCVVMKEKVDRARAANRFRGPVIGPIGSYLKLVSGKERFAKIVERALGGGVLDRFIVTNDADRRIFMNLRKEAGCSSRDCGLYQMSESSSRYSVPPPPCPEVETAASVLSISEDIVFNCLVDNNRIDQIALANSKESSEEALLIEDNGREAIRGSINQVFFLPHGDFWQVRDGFRSMISNDNQKQLRQSIGIDRTAAIDEAKREAEILKKDVEGCRAKAGDYAKKSKIAKVKWNEANNILKKTLKRIEQIEGEKEEIKAEADAAGSSVTIDTSEYEEDVRAASEALEAHKSKEEEIVAAIARMEPDVQQLRRQLDEILARNEKILSDISGVERQIEGNIRDAQNRAASIQKKGEKNARYEEAMAELSTKIAEKKETEAEALLKARILTLKTSKEKKQRESAEKDGETGATSGAFSSEELEAVEPVIADREPAFYKAKIERAQKQLERERRTRRITEVDPAVLLEKYQQAEGDLQARLGQIDNIEANMKLLTGDLKDRKKKWKDFRKHIENEASSAFDLFLNKKRSSGDLEFHHEKKTLELVVQKDYTNEMCQTRDVKALSGGERSYTTLSLLLALGESLETPFRVMDEFDVFLDPMARRVALRSMIMAAKDLAHRQFIFITPQDLSGLKPDPLLKIIKLRPPARDVNGQAQQTLDFATATTTAAAADN